MVVSGLGGMEGGGSSPQGSGVSPERHPPFPHTLRAGGGGRGFVGLGHLSPAPFPFFCLTESLRVFKPQSAAGIEAELIWERGDFPRSPPAGRAAGLGWAGLSRACGPRRRWAGFFLGFFFGGEGYPQAALTLDCPQRLKFPQAPEIFPRPGGTHAARKSLRRSGGGGGIGGDPPGTGYPPPPGRGRALGRLLLGPGTPGRSRLGGLTRNLASARPDG